MFFKQICIIFLILAILGYIYGDWVFYKQAHYMLEQEYHIPAYEAFERLIRYYPKSKYVKEARMQMQRLRSSDADLDKMLKKNEQDFLELQKKREKTESFR